MRLSRADSAGSQGLFKRVLWIPRLDKLCGVPGKRFEDALAARAACRGSSRNSARILVCLALSYRVLVAQEIPRAPDGHHDLQGIWNNETLTPVERPAVFAGKATVTDEEALAYEKRDLRHENEDKASAAVGGLDSEFIELRLELARVGGLKRTSLVIDPPDGKIPALIPEATARLAQRRRAGGGSTDSVQQRSLAERCLVGLGNTSGPAMMPIAQNANYQIVQTADAVMIMVEMIHDVRIIRIGGSHPPADVRFWLGDSIGHWEGDTLVADTTNFREDVNFRGASGNLHVIERFRRLDADSLLYKVTVDDPTTFTKKWTMEFPFIASRGPMYEYACHEGNYALVDILEAARKADAGSKR